MEIAFLGTGSAWCVPEYSCGCAICSKMLELGEERTRTAILVKGVETLLIDCGPDLRRQLQQGGIGRPDAILLTHEHADHFLGMDDLLAFRRAMPPEAWIPIPMYATETAWHAVEVRFGYLIGSLIEKRIAVPGVPLEGLKTGVTPFKTYHGPTAAGSVGYVLEENSGGVTHKAVYTSDFMSIPDEPPILIEPDILIMQAHWLNEPVNNRPYHMSFQNAMDYIRRWRPRRATVLVHLSAGDVVPGDPCNSFLKKIPPLKPLTHPTSGEPYTVPRCQSEWQGTIDRIASDFGLPGPIIVAYDGYGIKVGDTGILTSASLPA